MKTLLAVGCSLTDEKFESMAHPELDCSWPKWPEIVGKKLGYFTSDDDPIPAMQGRDYLLPAAKLSINHQYSNCCVCNNRQFLCA